MCHKRNDWRTNFPFFNVRKQQGGSRKKSCPECGDVIEADPDYWNITREFYCEICDEEFESSRFNKNTLNCKCGNELEWDEPFGEIQRFYFCKCCRKNFESLNFRQTKITCPYSNCDQLLHENKKKTIYFGKLFGRYRCPDEDCGKTWSSAFAFADEWQECKTCHSKTEPYHLIEHERGNNGKQGDKEHRSDLCGRCKSGRPCRSARFQAREETSDDESINELMFGMNLNQNESSEEEQYYDDYYYDEY
ncbi:unnamed protein product [Oikopleura dioica]|uniref:3CxxC-type domain-containing protein n=1 Tax=Oikopleura dioica TaxID=34765 RepID=E4XWI5_OIKDI|nr:unnamed protein product [Oikopleura dioica]